jgi:hypothetical protein
MVCWALLLLALLAACPSAIAAADQSGDDKAADKAASYSTGKSGSRLKWIAQQPEAVKTDPNVTPAQYTTPAAPRRAVRTARSRTADSASGSSSGRSGDRADCAVADATGSAVRAMPGERPYVAPAGPIPLNPNGANRNGSRQPPLGGQLEKAISPQQHELKGSCPSPKDLKHIGEIGTNITPPEGDLPRDCPLGNDVFQPRSFAPITYTWTASALCHKPLYFEDVQLERYGHMAGPWLQPFASGVNFFLTIPILPYKMGLELPNECMYTLGYYRPGDCAPYLFDPLPLSVRGAFFEAGAWVGAIYAFP